MTIRLAVVFGLGLLIPASLQAQPPAPKWVQMFDQGEADPMLKGLRTPRGIKAQIVAQRPVVGSPRQLLLDEAGDLLVVQQSSNFRSRWQMIALRDADGDGNYEKSEDLWDGLQARPVLVHDGWTYLADSEHLLRQRPYDAELAGKLKAEEAARRGPPITLADEKLWIAQRLIGGLSAKSNVGGLTVGPDGWLYLSLEGTDNRPQSWDGSQAAVLGSGAIVRFRPDGSRLQEFARGFAGPGGSPAVDALGVVFQVDRTPTGSRLVHVLEGGDYGGRSDLDPPQLDRPGTLPAMFSEAAVKTSGGAVVYSGTAFPKFFERLLIVPVFSEGIRGSPAVRAYVHKADGATLAESEQFNLIQSDDRTFLPAAALVGPDGAIYIADRSGRILRLSWSGTKDAPAIALTPPAGRPAADPAPRDKLLATLLDETAPTQDRAAAFWSLSRPWDAAMIETCLTLLERKDADLQRLAADALGDHLPDDVPTQEKMAEQMQNCLLTASLPARRSLYLALGKLGTKLETVPEWIFEATSVTPDAQTNRHLFDGHVRAVEMPKGSATELLIGNLDVALFDPNPEPEERQRLKKFVTATAEAMRTRELYDFLNRAIRDEKDYFSKLDSPLQVRLLTAYQNVRVEPPVRADAVAAWLEKHPAAAADVRQAAWDTLGKVGVEKPDAVVRLAQKLSAAKLDPVLKASVVAALKPHLVPGQPGEIDQVLEAVQKQ